MGSTFLFEMGEGVAITISGERGNVIGRAEYLTADPQYLVRYKTGDGRAIESWWTGDALVPDPLTTD